MLIEVLGPYKAVYEKAYLSVNNDGRRTVTLLSKNGDSLWTSYARYLMSVKLGYIVPQELEVDHIDNDKTNDDIDNLQLLTPVQNKLKEQRRHEEEQQVSYGFHCANCSTPFTLIEREMKKRIQSGGVLAFCSKSCSAKFMFHNAKRMNLHFTTLSDDDISKIKSLRKEGKSVYAISAITGFARNTVMKYW